VRLPEAVLAMAGRGADWSAWVNGLPRLVRDVLDEWELVLDGPPSNGSCSLVLPVREPGGDGLRTATGMLKLGFPDDESEHEPLALTAWAGAGAVELRRADPRRRAMLLERLDADTSLATLPVLEACGIVAGLYRRLHLPAPGRLRPLTAYVERWTARLAELPDQAPIPRRLVEQATALSRDLVTDEASVGTLVHTDLHYDNVLGADREPWLVIDPKPVSGDPHYEPAPMLWNRWDEVVASGDVRREVRRRFHALVDEAGLDEARARDWVIVRMIHNAAWTVEDSARLGGALTPDDQEWITTCIAICKAVQD
jgi:streptomycin 6-kinase